MMKSPSAAAMAVSAAPGSVRRLALALALLALQGPGGASRAAPADPPYPSTGTLRTLQLTTLDCGRDNLAPACDKARASADGLLDHPRLPGRCKDILWTIRQSATVAPANSLERREPIDAAAREVVVACRQLNRPAAKPEGKPVAPPAGGGGFGFGAPRTP